MKSPNARQSCFIGAVLAVAAFTVPTIVTHPRNAFSACGALPHAAAAPLTSASSKLLPPGSDRFTLRPEATVSMAQSGGVETRGMLLKFFGCAGVLALAFGQAVRAQHPKNGCYRNGARCFAMASVELSTPVPSVPGTMTSVPTTVAPATGHTVPQLVSPTMVASPVAQSRRSPQAARIVGRHRRKPSHARLVHAAATMMGTTRTTRRHVGATLYAHSSAHAVAAAASPYDPSQVRTQIQDGLKVCSRLRTISGRDSKTPAASKGFMTGSRTRSNGYYEAGAEAETQTTTPCSRQKRSQKLPLRCTFRERL